MVRIIIRQESLPDLYLNAEINAVTNWSWSILHVPGDRNEVPIKKGDSLFIEYPLNDALYEAMCIVEEIEDKSINDGPSTLLFVNSTSKLKRVQRRSMFRLSVSFPVSFRTVSPQDVKMDAPISEWSIDPTENRNGSSVCVGEITNISGTGLCMASESSLSKGVYIVVEFQLHDIPLKLAGRVIRSTPPENGREHLSKAALQFVNMDMKVQNQVCRFIFEEQRHQLQTKIV